MGFNSLGNRKPIEMASKSNHSEIIMNKYVQEFIDICEKVDIDIDLIEYPDGNKVDLDKIKDIKHIIAIDGGYSETYIQNGFPSSSIAFFNFGALLFDTKDLESIENAEIINPEDIKKLKEISKIPLVIPSKSIYLKGCYDFSHGVRKTIFDFFDKKREYSIENESFLEVLQWLLFELWNKDVMSDGVPLSFCPYGCDDVKVVFSKPSDKIIKCPKCAKDIYLTDYFRFHELINEPNGASGIFGYLSSLIEQILMVQIIKYFYTNNSQKLSEILFIKDGPLAFFGQTFRLYLPMRKLIRHLFTAGEDGKSIINVVGIEKSGAFVEHAFHIKNKLKKNQYYILSTDYISKYIAPSSQDPYGANQYYGWKVIYKTNHDDILVLSIPVYDYVSNPDKDNFSNIEQVLSAISKLRCNMYENSLVPIALINSLVSISEFPSSKILEKFTKKNISY